MCETCHDQLTVWENKGSYYSIEPCPECNADGNLGKKRWAEEYKMLKKKLADARSEVKSA